LGYLFWNIDDPDICPLDLYSCPLPPKPETAPDEYSVEFGCWEGADWCACVPSSSTGLSESELLPPRLPHLDFGQFRIILHEKRGKKLRRCRINKYTIKRNAKFLVIVLEYTFTL
jgi:hypothetical protein